MRLFLFSISLPVLFGCTVIQGPVRPSKAGVSYVYTDPASKIPQTVAPNFVILDSAGRPVDERNGHRLREIDSKPEVSEQEVEIQNQPGNNAVQGKFKDYWKDFNSVAGRRIEPKKSKASKKADQKDKHS